MPVATEHRHAEFLSDVRRGLNRREKRLPSKYLYDRRGSELFDQICDLAEYYPTRTELAITRRHARDIAQAIGPEAALVEYGSGSSLKTRLLLDVLQEPAAYVPVDISRSHLMAAADRIASAYPALEVAPVCADFTQRFELPQLLTEPSRRVAYFPGSTIGNFSIEEAIGLLKGLHDTVGAGGGLVIGIDLQKPKDVLEAAYNDAEGVTAEFNLNLLERINRELEADFSTDLFRHEAPYDDKHDRIEMLLVAEEAHTVEVAGERVAFKRGEAILTEHSHKYTIDGFARLAAEAGLDLVERWTDPRVWFAVLYLEAS